ncbi:7,8-didemethyl-8-hydroxy-5-deazariboflavin synthase subunit CofG [Anthocerotibacter panamensis]|uniref:7,8-didemethyl-8-hydroxy-5-deazariboflavin synthase subunit CofG n=1 Tax=Anthocerotibacter panamensis TaxID=2857077 RepID=UPI001C4078B0|nr:7,8-didemethyl-8-hydroxy-5-deazariboflavin synthase subunit CofG [Anthocerotibacter panamensis]
MKRPRPTVTYSPSFTLVPTYECFNRCTYCNFRQERGAPWLGIKEARALLEPLCGQGIIEILLLSGEVHPRDPRRGDWFQRLYDLAALALDLGFLPHTNAGILTYAEMQALKEVNSSMGLMLENLSERLAVHRLAPSKVPGLRLEQLVWAGQLQIAFTTGLLLGIGETHAERLLTLEAIAQVHREYGHIQEVILQPYRPGNRQGYPGTTLPQEELLELVAVSQQILGPDIALQVPPNLVQDLASLLQAGVSDLGGIGPVDVVNPDYDQPVRSVLQEQLSRAGWDLQIRLPVYPHLWSTVSPRVRTVLERYTTGVLSHF